MKNKVSKEERFSEWERLQDRRLFIEQFFKANPTSGTNADSRSALREELKAIKVRLNKMACMGITW